MLHKEFWGLMFLFFVGWIFLGANGGERIERGCRPIGWAGNAVVSLTALGIPSQQARVAGWFDKFEYGCQYATWRLIYEKTYQESLKGESSGEAAPPVATDPIAEPGATPSGGAKDEATP